jgi:hypothetical protein
MRLPTIWNYLKAESSASFQTRVELHVRVHRLLRAMGLIAVLIASLGHAQEPDAHTIIQKSVDANLRDWEAAPKYDFFERDLDPKGGSKTYEVRMILGSQYNRLIAINDRPLPVEQQAEEQRKFDEMMQERKQESASERKSRVAEYEKERKRDHLFMNQMVVAFDFKLTGEEKLNGHDTYVLKATPRKGYEPPNLEARVLPGMEGKLWVDKTTFQWVRVEAKVTRPVSIVGFLATVQPGTRFELENMPVHDGIWLPSHYSMRARAKILWLFTNKQQEDDTFFHYHLAEDSGKAEGQQ